jgi:DNA-binding NtrC family response regulator
MLEFNAMISTGDRPPPGPDARVEEWSHDAETEAAEVPLPPETSHAQPFVVVREGNVARVLDLQPGVDTIIGRAPAAGVRIHDKQVSRAHARIHYDGEIIRLRDLGSRNGTLVNGRLLKNDESTMAAGDTVSIGACTIVLATVQPGRDVRPTNERTGSAAPSAPEGAEDDMVVADPEIATLYDRARKVARTSTSVLLLGETGVGKDVLAQRIHSWSPRARKPFVRVNCAALPETLLESELFGHERGAFTGADKRKIGYVEAALGGTLFIDEIGDLPTPAQVKLLNVLETRSVTRLGGTQAIPVDVRVISATNRDLQADIARGGFRSDLYYRISPFTLTIPPLRARPAQIALLANVFARSLSSEFGGRPAGFAQDALDVLLKYPWPGNVRELRNAVEHALVMAEGSVLRASHFAPEICGAPAVGMRERLANLERTRIEEALAAEDGNQTRAAQRLGMPRRTLVHKLARYRKGE